MLRDYTDAGGNSADTARAARADDPITLFDGLMRQPAEAPAFRTAAGLLTFGSVRRQAGALAVYLNENGVGPGDRVLVRGATHPRTAVAVYAVLMAGASYLAVDGNADIATIHEINLRAATTTVIGDDEDDIEKVTSSPVMWSLNFRTFLDGLQDNLCDVLSVYPVPPDQPALVVFSSHAEQAPRGVAISHAALASNMLALARHMSIGTEDRLLGPTVITDHAGAFELFVPLLVGCSTILASTADDVPTLRRCDDAQTSPCANVQRQSGAHTLQSSSEVSRAHLALLGLLMPEMGYVPLVRAAADEPWRLVDGVHADLADDGTMHFDGAGVALGYVNEEAATAQAFVAREQDGRRVFRSELRVRRAVDGAIAALCVPSPMVTVGWMREDVK